MKTTINLGSSEVLGNAMKQLDACLEAVRALRAEWEKLPEASTARAVTICESVMRLGPGGYTTAELVTAIHAHLTGSSDPDALRGLAPVAEPGMELVSSAWLQQLRALLRGAAVAPASAASSPELKALDKQCRDDVARALGLSPSIDADFAWSYLLARISGRHHSGDATDMVASLGASSPLPPEIGRDLLGVIVDEVFDGAIEDARVIEDIYRVIARHAGALSHSQDCTCPSGDGSLRWPCAVHQQAEQKPAPVATVVQDKSGDWYIDALQPSRFGERGYLEDGTELFNAPPAAQDVAPLLEALAYYANGDHLQLADPDAWDTCSGEPMNFLHDAAGTASVEDGSIAKVALAAYRGQQGEGERT